MGITETELRWGGGHQSLATVKGFCMLRHKNLIPDQSCNAPGWRRGCAPSHGVTIAVVLTQHIPSVLRQPSDAVHQRTVPATPKLRSKMIFSYEWKSFYCT